MEIIGCRILMKCIVVVSISYIPESQQNNSLYYSKKQVKAVFAMHTTIY